MAAAETVTQKYKRKDGKIVDVTYRVLARSGARKSFPVTPAPKEKTWERPKATTIDDLKKPADGQAVQEA